jgi:hypothetical protein
MPPAGSPPTAHPKEGNVADKASQIVLAALSRAAADGAGLPLHATRAAPGLFPATALGKQAAQRCQDEGYLRPRSALMREYHNGDGKKPPAEKFAITEKGFTYLLSQVSPRPVLEDLVRVLEQRQTQLADVAASVRQMQQGFDALRASAEKVLQRAAETGPSPTPAAEGVLLSCLERWQNSGSADDCPLPELYRQACSQWKGLTIGQFHDELRRLHDGGQIYLHPWTGPLYQVPEPPYALLVGHLVAYYASLKR